MSLYYDNASTTQPYDFSFNNWYNSSALYENGMTMNQIVKDNTNFFKREFNAENSGSVFYTSGATESNNMLFNSFAKKENPPKIIISKIEHPSVKETAEHFYKEGLIELKYVGVDRKGHIKLEELEDILKNNFIFLCSIMAVNNETGTVQPLNEIGQLCKKYHTLFHSDITQACGKFDINMEKCKIDYISLSAHKFNGPKGIGCLITHNNICTSYLRPLIYGGHQQDNLRSGTLPVNTIVGMKHALQNHSNKNQILCDNININNTLKSLFSKYFNEDEYILNSYDYESPIFSISFKSCSSAYIVQELSKINIMVSTGSACHTGDLRPSYVLESMEVPEPYINNTIRISFDANTEECDEENLEFLVKSIFKIVKG